MGKLKIESLQNQQQRLVAAKVGRFLSMVVYDNEFGTKENKIEINFFQEPMRHELLLF